MTRLGAILKRARGKESRVQFSRKLELSYTFVRAMEHGLRFPSDKVLLEIADRLAEDPEDLFLAAYCDRSPTLARVLRGRGIELPKGLGESEVESGAVSNETLQPKPQPKPTPTQAKSVRAHDPF